MRMLEGRRLRAATVLVAAACVTMAAAPGADAGTVTVNKRGNVKFVAAPKEANRVVVSARKGEYTAKEARVTVTDRGARLKAKGTCRSTGPHTAVCLEAPKARKREDVDNTLDDVRIWLLDGRDTFAFAGQERSGTGKAFLNAGAGDDVLHGGDYSDTMNGGPGDDKVLGNGDDDSLSGGGGTDVVKGGESFDDITDGDAPRHPGADVLDGGADDLDSISYETRAAAVTVDLATNAPAGQAGEGDRISGFEDAVGGAGPDRLTGNDRPSNLYGLSGDDVIAGGGNPKGTYNQDDLRGGSGADTIDGGPGRDIVFGGSGTDEVACGDARDTTYGPDLGVPVADDCEAVGLVDDDAYLVVPARPVRGTTFEIGCEGSREEDELGRRSLPLAAAAQSEDCKGAVTITEAQGKQRELGSARYRSTRPTFEVTVPLNALGKQLAATSVAATITVSGQAVPLAWTIVLTA